jgi:type IV pilus assembly protein PilC
VIGALGVGMKIYFGTEKGRLVQGKLLLKLPVLGKINIFSGAAQFADTMSTMLSSGLTVNHAVEVTGKVLDNAILQEEVSAMIPKIEEGRGLGECMKASKWFPDNLKEMVSVGEESGSLDETLTTIADYYYNEQDHATQQAVSKLEPTIMVFLAGFAGFIVLAIYLPMFTMYNLM